MLEVKTMDKLNPIITTFFIIIIGATLIIPIANQTTLLDTSTQGSGNETITLSSSLGSTRFSPVLSLTTLQNGTLGTNLPGVCNLTFATGDLKCNTTTSSTLYAVYTYEPEEYISSSSTRTIIALVVVFFALSIFLLSFGKIKEGMEGIF